MPKSKIEAEFVKATKLDPDDYKNRQDFFVAIVEKVNAFKDAQWDKLSEAAQDWINAAVKKVKAKKRVAEFEDVGSVPDDDDDEKPAKKKKKAKPADDDDEEESEDDDEAEDDEAGAEDDDDKPAKKKKKKPADDDEDEDEDEDDITEVKPKRKKKKKPADDDDDEESDEDDDDKPAKKKKKKPADDDEDEDDEDEKPAKKKKKAKPADDDDDEDEDDEKPAKKKKKADKVEAKPTGVKVAIKTAIIADPEITVDALIKKLGKGGAPVSKVTVSNVRAEFRHTLKVLKELGKLKGVDI